MNEVFKNYDHYSSLNRDHLALFHKHEPEDFARCENCGSTLEYNYELTGWICNPACKDFTFIKGQTLCLIVIKERYERAMLHKT